jgi:hypothetical protein
MQHHLAILHSTYLDAILTGEKTIECRLGRMGHIPYVGLNPGDSIWLKESSGPVRAVATAGMVRRFDRLTPARVDWLRREFNGGIRAPASFWRQHRGARFATLTWLQDVCALSPFWVVKRDRRAWVVLSSPPVPGQAVAEPEAHLLDPPGFT